MENMKRIAFLPVALLLASLSMAAQENPEGTVAYALPQTTLSFDVEAIQESFFAGPYAKYASKYLGIDARQEDAVSFQLSSVKMTPCIEADRSARYVVALPAGAGTPFMQLTAQGLISTSDGSFGQESVWRFPTQIRGDFSSKGISSNYTSEASTLYQNVNSEGAYDRISVSQSIVVAKSPEQKAKEAADMILSLRKFRVQIVTGDTDANYSGESMGAAIEEISRLEKEYMTLFIGYSEYQTQKMKFDVVPQNDGKSRVYVAFRLSDTHGLVPADDMSGKPYLVDISAEELSAAVPAKGASSKGTFVRYRIPAICSVRLTDGVNLILQTRVPIYQYGLENTLPVSSK